MENLGCRVMRISEPQTGLQEIGYLRFYYDLFIIPFMVPDLSICRWFIICLSFVHRFVVGLSFLYNLFIVLFRVCGAAWLLAGFIPEP